MEINRNTSKYYDLIIDSMALVGSWRQGCAVSPDHVIERIRALTPAMTESYPLIRQALVEILEQAPTLIQAMAEYHITDTYNPMSSGSGSIVGPMPTATSTQLLHLVEATTEFGNPEYERMFGQNESLITVIYDYYDNSDIGDCLDLLGDIQVALAYTDRILWLLGQCQLMLTQLHGYLSPHSPNCHQAYSRNTVTTCYGVINGWINDWCTDEQVNALDHKF